VERLHQIKPVLPNGPDWSTIRVDNQRLFASLLLLRKITTRIGMTRDQSDRFRTKWKNLLDNPPTSIVPAIAWGYHELEATPRLALISDCHQATEN